jgi:protein gp37
MGIQTGVNWADHSFTAWEGCSKESSGCLNCYAERNDKRQLHENLCHWGPSQQRRKMADSYWQQPLSWDRSAAMTGSHPIVLCCELADWCDDDPGVPAGQRERLWDVIRQTPNLRWALLTKRTGNIARFLLSDWGDGWPQVILGATLENRNVLHRLDDLRYIPARARFISFEPLLEDLGEVDLSGISWAIVGGESGFADVVRVFRPEWAESLMNQCRDQGVAFWCKQMGGKVEYLGRSIELTAINENEVEQHSKNGEDWAHWPTSMQHLKVRELPLISGAGADEDQRQLNLTRIGEMECQLGELAADLGPEQAWEEQGLRDRLVTTERGLFQSRKERAEIVKAYHALYAPLKKWSAFCRITKLKRQTGYDLLQMTSQSRCTDSVQLVGSVGLSTYASTERTPPSGTSPLTVDATVKKALRRLERVFKGLTVEQRAEAISLLFARLRPENNATMERPA